MMGYVIGPAIEFIIETRTDDLRDIALKPWQSFPLARPIQPAAAKP